jgi:hypothetical protein
VEQTSQLSRETDGPFIEAKEVVGGYWLVEAPSKEEVVKWARRCPAGEGDTIEIRQIFGPEDFVKEGACHEIHLPGLRRAALEPSTSGGHRQ